MDETLQIKALKLEKVNKKLKEIKVLELPLTAKEAWTNEGRLINDNDIESEKI